MTPPERDVSAAWHELIDGVRDLDAAFLDGARAVVRRSRAPPTGTASC